MELLYSHILYVEDDELDILNMQWLAEAMEGLNLKVLNEYKDCEAYLVNHKVDLIILDQYINGEHFSAYPKLMSQLPYMVLTHGSLDVGALDHKPVKVLKKPLHMNEFAMQIKRERRSQDQPSLSYFDEIADESLRKEMLTILKEEFGNALNTFPELVDKKDSNSLKEVIHRLGSKFSLLAMKKDFDLSITLEKELMESQFDVDKMFNLFQGIQRAYEVLSTKEKNNASNNH